MNQRFLQIKSAIASAFAGKPARISYALVDNPCIFYTDGTGQYRVELSGKTWIQVAPGIEVPAPGCPCPERLFWANFIIWAWRNKGDIFKGALIALALVSAQALMWWLPENGAGEITLSLIATFSALMNAVLLFLFGAALVSVVAWNFGRGITIRREEDAPMLLGAGSINLSPDVLVGSLSDSEHPAEFAKRLELAQKTHKEGQYLVIIGFRQPCGIVVAAPPDEDAEFYGTEFLRISPPYQGADWPEDEKICPENARFESETWGDYSRYLAEFSRHWPEYSKIQKAKTGNPVKNLINSMKNAATLILLLLCPLLAFGQKSARVAEYLGFRYTGDKPTGVVRFIFQKAEIKRSGDGSKTYAELLPDGAFYRDADDAGKLVGITVNTALVLPASKEEVPQKQQPLVSRNDVAEAAPAKSPTLPDSLQFANDLRFLQGKLPFYKTAAWAYLKPFIGFVMYVLWFFTPVAFIAVMLLNVVARSAKANGNLGESVSRLQVVLARYAWFLSTFFIGCFYTAMLLTMWFNELGLAAICCIAVVGYFVATFAINRLTPNGDYRAKATVITTNAPRLNS